ncbi:MAG: SGNH/GDSL hydrolase family protein [Acidobacteriota bacterium]|nr:SGNH/GDSL hydrolase family protein [Acidobacteriota bacterium]
MMYWKPREWTLIGTLLLAIPGAMTVIRIASATAQTPPAGIVTTQVTDTVYRADGTPATGTVIVSWQAFTTAIGQSVASGTTSAPIGPNGALNLQLAPNAGSTPMGTYYTAVYHLDDGTVSREFWVVPASQVAVPVSSIKSSVLPTSVAMQTVSKSYVDTAIATAISGHPLNSTSPYVLKAGDTMAGPLALAGDPTTTAQAANKHYVDANVAALTSGLGQKVSLFPAASQTVAQPAGTQLQVNHLNGVEYATQFVNGLGSNGIANAVTSPDCASGCDVTVDRSYNIAEGYRATTWNSGSGGTHLEDNRNGQRRDNYMNPTSSTGNGEDAGQVIDVTSTRNSAAEVAGGGSRDPSSFGLLIKHQGLTGGSNLFPASLESVPYFKTNYDALNITGTYNTMGQHAVTAQAINCYGVGDCLIGSQYITTSGGVRDEADEGAHPYDLQLQEDPRVFEGTCSTGCVAGSTTVQVAPTAGAGTQGEGRYLIDKNPAKILTAGSITGGSGQVSGVPGPTATFSGTSFPVSIFLATAAMIPSQANNVAPGTVSVAIATSGVTPGFATSTAAVPGPNGVACVVDQPLSTSPHNYEMANYTVVDATHLQMTLNKVHRAGATIAFGGLCGYGLEQTVDTAGQIRQVFPVIGSYSSTGLYYAGGITSIIGLQGNTSAYLNVNLQIASIARSNGIVTVTTAGNLPVDVNGLTMNVASVADQSYNGSFQVTSTGTNTFTYTQGGANSTSTGGTVAALTGGFVLYPMAEVLSVYNTATQSVDGLLTLAPNNVAWAANDPLEQPHYYQQVIAADVTFVGQTTPRPTLSQTAGVQYQGNTGPGLTGWSVSNASPLTNYLGNGGTHNAPYAAYQATGVWKFGMDMQAGEESAFHIRCNSHGCGRWNSGYNLFELDGNTEVDRISYQPLTSTLAFSMGGAQFQFGSQGLSATTINAGTVNATTLNGKVTAAQLPLFGGSGASHAPGAVPDPGATAGTTRYLREDGTWSVPGAPGSTGLSAGTGLSANTPPVTGALADYNFLQGTGSTLTDNTGNGNTGTLGTASLAPSWTPTGLAFTGQQQVVLPAALNPSRTFYFAVYLNPISSAPGGQLVTNNKPVLLNSTLDYNGLNILYQLPGSQNDAGAFAVSLLAARGFPTTSGKLLSGFHVLAVTLGASSSDLDRFYIDGQQLDSYYAQSYSAGDQGGGNFTLGSDNAGQFTNSGFNGTFYRAVFLAGEDTPSTVAATSTAILADVKNRGVVTQPQPVPETSPQLFAIGDSITYGLNLAGPYPSTQAWPNNLTLTGPAAYHVVDMGIPSVTTYATLGSEPNRPFIQKCTTDAGPSIAALFLGVNDAFTNRYGGQGASVSAAATFATLMAEVNTFKRAGCKVFVATVASIGNATITAGGTADGWKDLYDAQILAQAVKLGADGVLDMAANPLMGADGACTNTTYFQGDCVHPTAAGQLLLAAAASNAINYYFGYNESNPHSVTSLPYSMTAGDGEVSLSGLTNAGTLTLPDCTGQSGATYRINNPQSAFAVSVVPLNGNQLINGFAVGSPITVPSNGTATLRDVPNPKSVSGCHWEM